MGSIPTLDHYISLHNDAFLYCKDKKALKITPVARGQIVYDTRGIEEASYPTKQSGYQVEYLGMRFFVSEEDYHKGDLANKGVALCAYHQLRSAVRFKDRIIPAGDYVVCSVEDEIRQSNPQIYTPDEFRGRFFDLHLTYLQALLRQMSLRP